LIKDKFDYPKTSTRDDVMACYKLVFNHDRAGRLIDAQEFEHLAFPRDRFQPELLAELLEVAGNTVSLNGDGMVSISHLYTERQITPLNLYLAENEGEAVRNAALDYGQAIKDLAATNIFPGDLFLKNFGVTRHGRVIFYDYDELLLVTDCRFRRIPPPRSWEDEISDQPWFTIRPNDVFPEQFVSFIGLPPDLKQAFIAKHSDLFEASYWRDLKAQHNAGIVPEIFPYKHEKQFRY
jgi:isocitrate dehydrogenase kinase/phosphatase